MAEEVVEAGGSTPATIFPMVFKIVNSNYVTIGSVTAYNYNDIRAHFEYNATVSDVTQWVLVDAKFNTIPSSDLRMDVGLETPDATVLPDFLHPDMMIAQINFTKCSGWSVQDGTFTITVKESQDALKDIGANDSYYFAQVDGNSMLKASVTGPDADGMMSFTATSSHISLTPTEAEPFILVAVSKELPTPVPTPTPTPVATSPTPTPSSGGSGISTFMLLLMVFIPAVIAGLIIVYYEMLRKGK